MKKNPEVKKQATKIKRKLNLAIKSVSSAKQRFCVNPQADFTRNRDFDFETVIKTIINFGSGNLQSEINTMFPTKVAPTKAAFCQQRNKIVPEAFSAVFNAFMSDFSVKNRYKGYRLLAFDGTTINLPRNPNDSETSVKASPKAETYNIANMNAYYDLLNRVYTDYSFDFGFKHYELHSMLTMADNIPNPQKTIIIADRGLGHLRAFVELDRKSLHYVIRTKDIGSNGFLSGLDLPDSEFDISVSKILTSSRKRIYRENSDYIIINPRDRDYLGDEGTCSINFRIVRFRISDNSYESLITNLPQDEFPADELKHLYSLRWGIETAFLDLKYNLSLVFFHSKKLNLILQEIIASVICFNACSLIAQSVDFVKTVRSKFPHKINFAATVKTCKEYFSSNGKTFLLDRLYQNSYAVKSKPSSKRYLHDSKPAKPFKYR